MTSATTTTRTPGSGGAGAYDRRLSPGATRTGGAFRLFLLQTRAELTKTLRMLDFTAAVVLLPVVLFVLFGASAASQTLPDGRNLGPYVVASFGSYSMLGVVLFFFGEGIASERGAGWLRLVRATPLNPVIYLGAKLVVASVVGALILAILFPVAAVVSHVRLGLAEWLALGAALVLSAAALAPIGFLIGFWARPASASAIALLLLLPVSFVSGYWTPAPFLPEAVQRVTAVLPTYHYAEVARSVVGIPGTDPVVSVAWLVGSGLVFGAIAVWGYRRDVGKQFA